VMKMSLLSCFMILPCRLAAEVEVGNGSRDLVISARRRLWFFRLKHIVFLTFSRKLRYINRTDD